MLSVCPSGSEHLPTVSGSVSGKSTDGAASLNDGRGGDRAASLHEDPAQRSRANDPARSARRQAQDRRRRQATAQTRMTRMLFIATFFLFILWLPNIWYKSYALGSLFVDFLKSSHHANVVSALLVLKDVCFFNSVVNVFIYGMASKRFRAESITVMRGPLRRCRRGGQP